jgi:hypothetical protein
MLNFICNISISNFAALGVVLMFVVLITLISTIMLKTEAWKENL